MLGRLYFPTLQLIGNSFFVLLKISFFFDIGCFCNENNYCPVDRLGGYCHMLWDYTLFSFISIPSSLTLLVVSIVLTS